MSLSKQEKEQIIKKFEVKDGDTGSTVVQIALLSERIAQLTEHLKANHKDFACKRGLLSLVSRRRSFLKYLQRIDMPRYESLIAELRLKK